MPTGIAPSSSISYDRLEHLLIDGQWWLRNAHDLLQKTPTLKFLTLRDMPHSQRRSYRHLVLWTSITTLHFSEHRFRTIGLQDFMHILRLTPHLSCLAAAPDSFEKSPSDEPEPDVVILPALRNLRISTSELIMVLF